MIAVDKRKTQRNKYLLHGYVCCYGSEILAEQNNVSFNCIPKLPAISACASLT